DIAQFITHYCTKLEGVDKRRVTQGLTEVKWSGPSGDMYCSPIRRFTRGSLHVFSTEAFACVRKTQTGLERGWSELIMEGDALEIIKKCQFQGIDKSQIGVHIRDIQMLADRYQHIDFKYTPRSANGLSHILATKTLKRGKIVYHVRGGVPAYVEWKMTMEREQEPD
ncbi:hypothetical protein Gorai_000274, partial [Gossypium raimondii]|nr:hypothetical protein [Gossypium raimondii]